MSAPFPNQMEVPSGDQPIFEHTSGRSPEYFKWLEKLGNVPDLRDRDTTNRWLEALGSIKEAFPCRQRQTIPLREGMLVMSWPSRITLEDIEDTIEILSLMQKHWSKRETTSTDSEPK